MLSLYNSSMALEQRKNENGNDSNPQQNAPSGEEVGPYTRSLEEELTANPLMYYGDPTAGVDPAHVGLPTSHFQHLQHNIEAEAASILTQKQQHSVSDNTNVVSSDRRRQYNQRKSCSHPNCTKPAQSKGLCSRHGGKKLCLVEGCPKQGKVGGVCIAHGGGRVCSFPDCLNKVRARGFCRAHRNEAPNAASARGGNVPRRSPQQQQRQLAAASSRIMLANDLEPTANFQKRDGQGNEGAAAPGNNGKYEMIALV